MCLRVKIHNHLLDQACKTVKFINFNRAIQETNRDKNLDSNPASLRPESEKYGLTNESLERIFLVMFLAQAICCCCPNDLQLVERDAREFME